jgi:pantoate--beta-alanine ligase
VTTIIDTVADLRAACDAARAAGRSVGLVPTMGYLHAGHRSLVHAAREATDFVVVTIFVNPLQFAPTEDLDRYPRDLAADLRTCEAEGVDVLFHPSVEEMYPAGAPATKVVVEGLTAELCGRSRPTHFTGVTTVVAKLFAMTGPCTAFFGNKDYQQLVVVRRMALDLDLPVAVIGCPIVREPDGLAMSSRNAYLSADERESALALHASLDAAADAVEAGERRAVALRRLVQARLDATPLVEPEYVEVRDADDLDPVAVLDGHVLVAVAARVGGTRLIDNVRLRISGDRVVAERGTTVAGTGAPAAGSATRESVG